MQQIRAKYFANRPITFCDRNGANIPTRKRQNAPKGLTHTAIPPVPQMERIGQKKSENNTEIYSLTVCRSITLGDRQERENAENEQVAAAGMVVLPRPPKPHFLQSPLPWVCPRLQTKLPGSCCPLPALLVETLETARLRAVTVRYTPFPAKEVTFHRRVHESGYPAAAVSAISPFPAANRPDPDGEAAVRAAA